LDVGNDSHRPWEWNTGDPNFVGPERVWTPPDLVNIKINDILRHGCGGLRCVGCYINGIHCYIPFVFINGIPPEMAAADIRGGNLTVDEINFIYWIVTTLVNNSYRDRFRYSVGSRWGIEYHNQSGDIVLTNGSYPVPDEYTGTELFEYSSASHAHPGTHDAVDDAMYRLLNESMDRGDGGFQVGDGVVDWFDFDRDGSYELAFHEDTMWFDSEDDLVTRSLWGPAVVKLIVWVK